MMSETPLTNIKGGGINVHSNGNGNSGDNYVVGHGHGHNHSRSVDFHSAGAGRAAQRQVGSGADFQSQVQSLCNFLNPHFFFFCPLAAVVVRDKADRFPFLCLT